jgi:repressor of nif and glnA expression
MTAVQMSLLARNTDPDTSHEAAASLVPHLPAMQAEILTALCKWWGPATAYEIMVYLNHHGRGRQQNSVSTRLAALHELGFVRDSGARKAGSTNRLLTCWEATPAGREAVR